MPKALPGYPFGADRATAREDRVRQDSMAVGWLGQSTPRIARVRHTGASQPTSNASWASGDAPERVHQEAFWSALPQPPT